MSDRVPSSEKKRTTPATTSYERPVGVGPTTTGLLNRTTPLSGDHVVATREKNLFEEQVDEKFALVTRRIEETFNPVQEEKHGHVLDLEIAVDDLWEHLHQHPVSLAKKAEMIAALEPVRRRLRSEPYATEIKETRAREAQMRPIYLAAKSLFHARQTQRLATGWDRARIIEAGTIRSLNETVRKYLATEGLPPKPSLYEREMDKEIRAMATALGISFDRYTGNLIFEQAQAAYNALTEAAHHYNQHPSKALEGAVWQAQQTMHEALLQEMQEYETPAMIKERAGLVALREALCLNSIEGMPRVTMVTPREIEREPNFVREVYKDILKADTSPDPEADWAMINPRFRELHQAEQIRILRLARYYREVIRPREHLLLGRHITQRDLESTNDPDAQQQLSDRIHDLESPLRQEVLTLDSKDPTPGQLMREIDQLHHAWEERFKHLGSPNTIGELSAPWGILEKHYDHALTLFEQLGRFHDLFGKEVRIALRQKLTSTTERMHEIERHYATTLCEGLRGRVMKVDTMIWRHELPGNVGSTLERDPLDQIWGEAQEIERSLEKIAIAFPPLARSEPWKKAWEQLQNTKLRLGVLGAGSSNAVTARPPRFAEEDPEHEYVE